jgi:hypothetical protein
MPRQRRSSAGSSRPVSGRTSPTPGRNLLLLGLLGLAGGCGAAVFRLRGRSFRLVTAGAADPQAERRLRRRIDEVTKRERALAKRAGEVLSRERAYEQRIAQDRAAAERAAAEREAAARPVAPPAPPAAEPATVSPQPPAEREPEQAPLVQPETAPVQPAAAGPDGSWSLHQLERLARERRGEFPERAEEWDTYLFLLREHASADGRLARSFDGLVNEVFGDIVTGRS